MNQEIEYMAAIDIGTTETIAIIGKKTAEGKLDVIGLGSAPSVGVKRGMVVNIEETANAIKTAVDQAMNDARLQLSKVFVGIAGQHIKSISRKGERFIDAPEYEIKQSDVDAIKADMYKIPLEAGEEIIHVIPQQFVVDNEANDQNPVGISGKQLEAFYHIVIGQTTSAKNIEKCVKRAGLEVIELVLEPLASSEAVLTEDEKEAGVVLVDIGGGTTDIAVFHNKIVRHTAVIPFGGNVVTNDIKEGCATLHRQAEQLKCQFGSAWSEVVDENKIISIPGISGRPAKEISFKNLSFIIQSRMEEIVDAVMFEVENSGCLDKLSAGIVVTGGGALLSNLPELFNLQTGYEVRVGIPSDILAEKTDEELYQSKYATAIGLLIKGFENPKGNEVLAPAVEEPVADVGQEPDVPSEPVKPKPSGSLLKSWADKIKTLVEDKDIS